MNNPIAEMAEDRIRQALESLKEAEVLLKSSLLRGCVNRAYYAMFYAVLALAVLQQASTSKHSGAIAFFDRVFIKPGIFQRDLSKSLHLAFQRRQDNDYGNVLLISEEEAQKALSDAFVFVDTIKRYIEDNRI